VARLGTVSARVAELTFRAGQAAAGAGFRATVQCHAANGQVYLIAEEASVDLAAALRELAHGAGGTCTFLRLPAPLVGQVDPWGPVGPEVRIMRGIKEALDPAGLFSPGRFVDRI
jgi:glycolate oxidase FAD binding subunit